MLHCYQFRHKKVAGKNEKVFSSGKNSKRRNLSTLLTLYATVTLKCFRSFQYFYTFATIAYKKIKNKKQLENQNIS
jgi:hypothetical protein